jgi:hypothetical protein
MKIKNLLLSGLLLTSASHAVPLYKSNVSKNYNNKDSVLSIGPNMGYNITEAVTETINKEDATRHIGYRRFKINNYSMGLHIDYNYPLSDTWFIGGGYNIVHLPFGKDYNTYGISLTNKEYARGVDTTYKHKLNVLFHKKNSQYFTVRTGKFLSDNVSINANVSMVISEFRMSGAIFSYEKMTFLGTNPRSTYDFNQFKKDIESNLDFRRVGVAPGIGITFHLDEKFSTSLNYSYEIYPANKNGSRPRMTTHNVFTKFSYHI